MTRNLSQSQKPNTPLQIQCIQQPYLAPFVCIVRRRCTHYYYPSQASIRRLQKTLHPLVVGKTWLMRPLRCNHVGWVAEVAEVTK